MQGYVSAMAAALLFGIQYVPVKKHDIFDGTVFQWFMCSGILFTGMVLGTFSAGEVPQIAFVDLIGGMFWTAQNMLLMPVVKLLGLGLSFAVYSATNVLSGYAIGRFGLFGSTPDAGRVPWLRDAGAACLVVSFVVMVFIRPDNEEEDEKGGPQAHSAISVLSQGTMRPTARRQRSVSCPNFSERDPDVESGESEDGKRKRLFGLADPLLPVESAISNVPKLSQNGAAARAASSRANKSSPRAADPSPEKQGHLEGRGLWAAGVVLVVLAGFLNALSALPFNWWLAKKPTVPRAAFVFAQALGTWMVSTALYLAYASGRKMFGFASPPHTCIRPAFLSGFFWAFGFVFMCAGIDGLGFTAGYTYAAVLPVVVSSLLSVLWFREIRGRRQICLFLLCFLIQSSGVVCIALGSH